MRWPRRRDNGGDGDLGLPRRLPLTVIPPAVLFDAAGVVNPRPSERRLAPTMPLGPLRSQGDKAAEEGCATTPSSRRVSANDCGSANGTGVGHNAPSASGRDACRADRGDQIDDSFATLALLRDSGVASTG